MTLIPVPASAPDTGESGTRERPLDRGICMQTTTATTGCAAARRAHRPPLEPDSPPVRDVVAIGMLHAAGER